MDMRMDSKALSMKTQEALNQNGILDAPVHLPRKIKGWAMPEAQVTYPLKDPQPNSTILKVRELVTASVLWNPMLVHMIPMWMAEAQYAMRRQVHFHLRLLPILLTYQVPLARDGSTDWAKMEELKQQREALFKQMQQNHK